MQTQTKIIHPWLWRLLSNGDRNWLWLWFSVLVNNARGLYIRLATICNISCFFRFKSPLLYAAQCRSFVLLPRLCSRLRGSSSTV